MKRIVFVTLCALVVLGVVAGDTWSKTTQDGKLSGYRFKELPHGGANTPAFAQGSLYQAAAVGSTLLGWWQFDTAAGQPDEQGWTKHDITGPPDVNFHVDGSVAGGAGCCPIVPVTGVKSMWCGACPSADEIYCGYSSLPGYGNSWYQSLITQTLACTTLSLTYTAVWDSEPAYDFTYVQYWDGTSEAWVDLPVDGGAGKYDGIGGPLVENFVINPPDYSTVVRFFFVSDGAWSDEDGLWPTNEGAFKVDDITLACTDQGSGFSYSEDWEDEVCGQKGSNDGVWHSASTPGFGVYAALRNGAGVIQEDPCRRLISNLWGFFDDPVVTNYSCGGWPLQGAVPYGPDANGLYMNNEIWSPKVDYVGSGNEVRFRFASYRDLSLDGLVFYVWHVRSWVADCPQNWEDYTFVYYGGQRDWLYTTFDIGPLIDAGATHLQLALGAVDMCGYWCGIYGTGSCHSHAPLFDQVRLVRIDNQGPQWNVRHIDIWQDNFPEEGGVDPATSYARCDMAQDILPNNNPILPGDSLSVGVNDPAGFADDNTGGRPGKAIYAFVRVTDRFGNAKAGKSGLAIQSPDDQAYSGDPNAGLVRYPWVGNVLIGGETWSQYRMDYNYTSSGGQVSGRYNCDLMDLGAGATGPHYNHANENTAANTGVFTPGDVVNYFLGAQNSLGTWSYWHRTLDGQGVSRSTLNITEAAADPCEWSVLPDAGLLAGDILYVDDADDRGGPAQLYFDWAFKYLNIEDGVDRFDVLGPSSAVGNSLASRVKDLSTQMIGDPGEVYQKVLWNSSDLSSGLMGDGGYTAGGGSSEKSNDYALCEYFLTNHPGNPGWYAAGDDFPSDWNQLTGAAAVNVRSFYMNYNLVGYDHKLVGEPVSPLVVRSGDYPIGPAAMYAYGGCPVLNDFDVIQAIGSSNYAMEYSSQGSGNGAVIRQATPNAAGSTARFVLSGFGYNFIRDDDVIGIWPDRVTHLRDILIYFQNILDEPIGIDPVAYANSLDNAYPNPFNPTTTIKYSIAERGHVTLKVYNAAGQLVRTLVDEMQSPAATGLSKTWHGMNDHGQPVSSGVYFYRLSTNRFTHTKKMVLLK